MSIVNVDLIPNVKKILTLLGDNTVFTHIAPGTFTPNTGVQTAGATTTHTCRTITDNFNVMELASETIQANDMKCILLPTDGYVPVINDTCSIDGITYRIMSVLNDSLQGSTFLYTLQLRS